ncbi:hypothetical protein A4H97_26405 [Niastella yeongjuensis]|uniref:Uncharacterized protein n=1 Tax=Niastella yeongjuensis TaxID=354355 RepID=A0A1V9F0D5_9BACT|nr:hypothetical protein [Niastella yeongjuensis]OQP51746.1 hypothetical protein A4H97_26405 [Niastella yeongjuensis]SEP48824.1 hypothetical protein SAMN05660816_06832 [Niastella yeongjuensis]
MATKIKHILNNLEVQPPPGVWPGIAARLNAEFDAEDTPVAQKMFDLAVTPPVGLWSTIAAELGSDRETDEVRVASKLNDLSVAPPASVWKKIAAYLSAEQTAAKKEGRVIDLHSSRRAIVAAAAMVLLTVGAWYFLDKANNTADTPGVASKAAATPANSNHSTAPGRTRAADTEIGERLAQKPIAALSASTEAGLINNRFTRRGARRTAFYDYQPIATSYADDVQAVDFNNANSPDVEAPLIRDAKGQVILDKKLVTSPDNCYINVTSPNGEQTRISSKFLHIISTLNQEAEPQDYFDFMMQENSLWKVRFSEWKEKFMNQASFVPTATSFTDILELKDLLIENE